MQAPPEPTIAVLGLGYVGLPLAVKLSEHYTVIGIDRSEEKVAQLRQGRDPTNEVGDEALAQATLTCTTDAAALATADVIIVTVPTPVDEHNVPDLGPVHDAAKTIGSHCKRGVIVVLESTVYPGVTEEEVGPLIAQTSGYVQNKDFFLGYSPERSNPGDKEHTVETVIKVVSGSTPETTKQLATIYGSVAKAGVHIAPSIKVAEAEKVFENIQRDVNIALVNELAQILDRLDVDVQAVLDAASTKWNFHRYTPGLVGGHCIGVDPYYLAHKAQSVGYTPSIILAARSTNDAMHEFYANKTLALLKENNVGPADATIVVLGLTFKENCNDERNSRAKPLVAELRRSGARVIGIDPWLTAQQISAYGCEASTVEAFATIKADVVVATVPHKEFFSLELTDVPLIDIKGKLARR